MNVKSKFELAIYALQVVVAAIILIVLFRRKYYRTIPWFTIYIGSVILMIVTLGAVSYYRPNSFTFFYSAWFLNFLTIMFAFIVIVEIFRGAFSEYATIRRLGLVVFVVAALATMLIAVFTAPYGTSYAAGAFYPHAMMHILMVTHRGLRLIQISLLIALFSLSSYLAIQLEEHLFGIGLGYGLYAAVNLCYIVTGANLLGSGQYSHFLAKALPWVDQLAYLFTLILWLTYLRKSRPKPGPMLLGDATNTQLEEWGTALSQLSKR